MMANRSWLLAAILCLPPLPGVPLRSQDPAGAEAKDKRDDAPLAAGEDREALLLFNTASRLYRQKNWREAAAAFGDFLRRFSRRPDAGEAHFARGYCLHRLGEHALALPELEAAQAAARTDASARGEDTPWAPEAHFYHGRSLEALAESAGEPGKRRELLRRAARSYGEAVRLCSKPPVQGRARPGGGREETAEDPDRKAASRRDLWALALTSQGEALYQAGLRAEAVQALGPLDAGGRAVADSPHQTRGVYLLALARHARAQEAGARADHPDRAAARELLSRLTGAEMEKDPVWEDAALFLARLLEREGSRREALDLYSRV